MNIRPKKKERNKKQNKNKKKVPHFTDFKFHHIVPVLYLGHIQGKPLFLKFTDCGEFGLRFMGAQEGCLADA